MNWRPLFVAGMIASGAAGMVLWVSRPPASATVSLQRAPAELFAAPGRIEGAQVSVSVGAGATGVVREVLVVEGQSAGAGQVLARLECDALASEVSQKQAEATAIQAHADVVRLGARPEEIEAGAADLRLAEARSVEATIALQRNATLVLTSAGTRRDLTTAQRDERVATALQDAARERLKLLHSGPRPEEVTEALARAEAAKRAYAAALAQLARCDIRSPITGTVLRKVISAGELVSVTMPQALFVIADTSRLRVRAEVDEEDVNRLAVGQSVTVLTSRSQGARLTGRVVEIGRQMGRRRVMTNDPGEKSDRDVLEAVVELDQPDGEGTFLPVGLRVSVLFGDTSTATAQR